MSCVTGLYRVQDSRFELFNETKNNDPKTFDNILRLVNPAKLVACYQSIDKNINDAAIFAKKWLSYQALWDVSLDYIKEKLGDDLRAWYEMLVEFRGCRKLLESGTGNSTFGAVEVSYLQIQSQVSLKYDSWWVDVMGIYTQTLGKGISLQLSNLKKGNYYLMCNIFANA